MSRVEAERHSRQIIEDREQLIRKKRDVVVEVRRQEDKMPSTSKQYHLDQKRGTASATRTTEDEWRRLEQSGKDAFARRAAENHERNDLDKEHMRDARRQLIKKNNEVAWTERRLKQEHASAIVQSRSTTEGAKRAVRDTVFSQRFVSADKSRFMRESVSSLSAEKIEQTAMLLGIIKEPPQRPNELVGSPYRLGSRSPPKCIKSSRAASPNADVSA